MQVLNVFFCFGLMKDFLETIKHSAPAFFKFWEHLENDEQAIIERCFSVVQEHVTLFEIERNVKRNT